MSRFHMILNGRDISAALNKWGMSYQPVKVQGVNQGVSQGGSLIENVVKVKDWFSFTGNAVDEETYRFLSVACGADYVTCTYERPSTGESVSVQMVATLSAASRKPMGGAVWYDGWTLTLEER